MQIQAFLPPVRVPAAVTNASHACLVSLVSFALIAIALAASLSPGIEVCCSVSVSTVVSSACGEGLFSGTLTIFLSAV